MSDPRIYLFLNAMLMAGENIMTLFIKEKQLEVHDKRGTKTHPWSISSWKIDEITKQWVKEKDHVDEKNYSNQQVATEAAKKFKIAQEKLINEGKVIKEEIKGVVRNSDGTIKEWF